MFGSGIGADDHVGEPRTNLVPGAPKDSHHDEGKEETGERGHHIDNASHDGIGDTAAEAGIASFFFERLRAASHQSVR